MVTAEPLPLELLYERDETAWLEAMSVLAAEGRLSEMDHRNLSEYLSDMSKRDRREVFSQLVILVAHMLKWEYQPDRRSGTWSGTIREQRRELRQMFESRTLRNHAEAVLSDAYAEAREQAADETELAIVTFPAANGWNLAEVIGEDAV
ncbi:MAG: DUF29 domain-containing protein [Planctomycetes bacterium]|nr:DUF29 domain-containing protein [Planctomycetota bacterium]